MAGLPQLDHCKRGEWDGLAASAHLHMPILRPQIHDMSELTVQNAPPGHPLFRKAKVFAQERLGWNISWQMAKKAWAEGKCLHANALTWQQRQVIRSIEENRRTAVKSTHSMGKSELIGFLGAWWIARKEHNMVLMCSAKEEQASRILYPKAKRNWLKAFPEKGNRDQRKALKNIIQPNRELNPEWMTLVISGRDTETWQGYHAGFGGELLLIIDEGSKMTQQLAYASEGLISGGGGAVSSARQRAV